MGEDRGVEATARRPLATYRLQLHGGFTFRDAERIIPYLAGLGVDTLYLSPIFRAQPGSRHGYDVVDAAVINPELGGEAAFDALVAALRARGMGLLLDVVPNHMGVARGHNAWWQNLLENGQASPYAAFFDVDWHPPDRALHGKVLLPILGDHYGAVLERGELRLRLTEGAFVVDYFETPLPIAPPTYPLILRPRLDALVATLPPGDPPGLELQSIVTALERLSGPCPPGPEAVAERQREQTVAKRRLAALLRASAPIRSAVARAVAEANGTPGDPASFDLLHGLLDAQPYRLAFWRVAAEEINYRRFFAVNELAAIRQEEPAVFAATHALLLRLLADGKVAGVRVDHPDGLWDPPGYFRALREAAGWGVEGAERPPSGPENGGEQPDKPGLVAPSSPSAPPPFPFSLIVEKILEHGEDLPEGWPVDGTVGYDFAAATGLFVDGANRRAFDELYARFVGGNVAFADEVYAGKETMLRTAFVGELNVLARALNRIAEQDRHTRDFTLDTLRRALRETIACFPVYRTYVTCGPDGEAAVSERDRRYVETAIARAKRRAPAIDASVLDFVGAVLLAGGGGDPTPARQAERCRFAMRFQQLTGPVMAKGVEDTAFYRYHRLVSLNEVGGDPARFGTPPAAFHRQNAERRRRWPHALLASSTHDTKRSEDVRARIAVLSELPGAWRAAINRWARLNRRHKTRVDGRPAPDRNDECLLYQTLLGVWPEEGPDGDGGSPPEPAFTERIVAYMAKATREAQIHTSWNAPHEAYEAATTGFVRALLDPATGGPFLKDAAALRATLAHVGAFNALSQQLLKLTSPGVPDLYQGTELWDLSLVDPDNRRSVDYAGRMRRLRELRRRRPSPRLARDLVAAKADGRVKLFLTQRALDCRRARPDLFARGAYLPLEARGGTATGAEAGDHVCAFARRTDEPAAEVVVAVPRLVAGLCGARGDGKSEPIPPTGGGIWGDATLPVPGLVGGERYRNVFTDERVGAMAAAGGGALPLAAVFASFPVALLERVGDG